MLRPNRSYRRPSAARLLCTGRWGPGFLERAYERALHLELEAQGVEFHAQVPIWVTYRDTQLMSQRLDLIAGDSVLVEIKAVARLEPLFVGGDDKHCST